MEGPPCAITGVFSMSMGNGSGWRVAKGEELAKESCFSMSRGEVGEIGDVPSMGEAGEPVYEGRVEWSVMFTLGEAWS